jgi:hypothetical protein
VNHQPKRYRITQELVRKLANKSCKRCYGTGLYGVEVRADGSKRRIMCSCVSKAVKRGEFPLAVGATDDNQENKQGLHTQKQDDGPQSGRSIQDAQGS